MEETPKSPQSPQSPSGSSNSSDSTSSSSSSERTISTGSPDALNLLGSLEPSNLSTTDVSNYASTDSDSDSLNTRELRNYEMRTELSETHDSSPLLGFIRSRSSTPNREYLIRVESDEDDIIFRIDRHQGDITDSSSTATNIQLNWNGYLPTEIISQEHLDKNLQCSICLSDFIINQEVKKLNCGHYFHEGCILPWLRVSYTCPICRAIVLPINTSVRIPHMDT